MTSVTARPLGDVRPGATEQGNGEVVFALWAPGKDSVHLIGDFNGWNRAADRLQKTDNDLWVCTRTLKPGRYRYQYLIDGHLVICDPYARAVEHPAPGQVPQAVLEIGRPPFVWKHDQWQRPPFRDLVIYELHIADFTPEATFRAVTDRLDYLRGLGINAIELLPVTEGASETDWGYTPVNYFAARCRYGTADDLKQLIDEAHAHGIAIVLDVVFSHTAHEHPFNRMYPYEKSPWYGEGIGGGNEFGLPTFDHRRSVVQAFFRDVQDYWLNEFHVDGFRYDYAVNIGVDGDKGLPFLAKQARIVRPHAYLIAEYLPEDPKHVGAVEFDAAWHVRSCYALKALVMQGEYKMYDGRDFEETIQALDPQHEDYEQASHMINYIESHDEERLVLELRQAGLPGDPARRRLALAATILFTAPGVPLIYHGQEFGETAPLSRNERNPLRWELLSTEGGQGLFNHYQRLCQLRRDHPALRDEGYSLDASHNDEKWMVFHRWNDAGDVVVVAANFSDEARTVPVVFPERGRWHEVFRGRNLHVSQDRQDYELEPNTAAIFVRT